MVDVTVPTASSLLFHVGVSTEGCRTILNNSVKEQMPFNLCRNKTEIGRARGTHGRMR
jgi:hypothetical protein